jgi:hypothetical protein
MALTFEALIGGVLLAAITLPYLVTRRRTSGRS